MKEEKKKKESKSYIISMLIVLMVLMVGSWWGVHLQNIQEDICESKGLKYKYRSFEYPQKVCYEDINWNRSSGTYERLYYPLDFEYEEEYYCDEIYTEHLVKVGSDISFELIKCKDNGLTLDVKRIQRIGR